MIAVKKAYLCIHAEAGNQLAKAERNNILSKITTRQEDMSDHAFGDGKSAVMMVKYINDFI